MEKWKKNTQSGHFSVTCISVGSGHFGPTCTGTCYGCTGTCDALFPISTTFRILAITCSFPIRFE